MKIFAFINVHKNAGTSIYDLLSKLLVNYTVISSPKKDDNHISFAVSRNPYTRCVSSWKHCLSTRDRSLLDCLANPPSRGDKKRPHDDYTHFTMKQSEFMFKDGLKPTHILRFEHLQEDLESMFRLYNISIPALKKLNGGNYNYTLSDEECEAIYEFYKEDFDNLGYEK